MTILNPTQIIFVRQIRDYLPVVGHKLEPKQVWGLIQETRSRVMVRRGDTDMEKDQIFPRTRFAKNKDFRKKNISKFLTITRIIVQIIIYRL